jgi:3-oxoacyl-[acyl-carrier protein] reductase
MRSVLRFTVPFLKEDTKFDTRQGSVNHGSMDLGIAGCRAIVCASSQGLGRACAEALAAEGVNVVVNGRDPEKLEQTAAEIRGETGTDVAVAVADITTDEGRAALLAACPEPDILVNNNAGPRPGTLEEMTDADLEHAIRGNFVAPLLLTQAVVPGMRERTFGRIVNITSAMVTRPNPVMVGSAGARAGLTAAMKAISMEAAIDNVTINNLLPERIDSPRQHYMAEQAMERLDITYDEARRQQADSIAAKRLGRPEELGAACAFLCSTQAGFISGQNLHLDGGSYPGLV